MRYSFPAMISAILLAGCAAKTQLPPAPAAVAAPPPPPGATTTVTASYMPGIAVAPPGTEVRPLPTGVILLTQSDLERNKMVCQAFFGQLRPARQLESSQSYAVNIINVFWLDRRNTSPGPEILKSCDKTVLRDYDYDRAGKIIATLSPRPTGMGPFLVGYNTSSENPKIMIDASTQTSQAAMNAVVAAWVTSASATSSQLASRGSENRSPSGLCTWARNIVPRLLNSSSIIVNVVGLVGEIATSVGCSV